MGGTNETKIDGLRFHINRGEVHIHDDSASRKFTCKAASFRTSLQDAFDALKKQDGLVKVEGKDDTDLCLVRDGSDFSLFLTSGGSIKRKLQDFIRNC
jgi:hypothetical protein